MADADQSNLTTLTVDLLSAYVANNNVQHGDLPELVKSTHAALKAIDSPEPPAPVEPEYKAAVSVKKSLASPAHIISLIDGKPYQTLKRHLARHGLTPDQYRERYSLLPTYPMVAPAYSENRRAIAEKLGLGRRVKGAQEAAPAVEEKAAEPIEAPKPVAIKAKKATPAKAAASVVAPAKASAGKTAPKTAGRTPRAAKTAPVEAVAPDVKAPKARGSRKTTEELSSAPEPAAKPAPRRRASKAAPAEVSS